MGLTWKREWMAFALVAFCLQAASGGEPVSLFDGKTLDQWTVITCDAVVQDGAILLKAGNGLVQTKKKYQDFVFEFEWKTLSKKKWDSGVYFRYSQVPPGRPWPTRYQVNLLKGMEGNLVGFKQAVNKVPIKSGWNRFVLTVHGTTATLVVNGKPAWKVDGLEQARGYIALQAEVPGGGQFLFRKIRITELKAPKRGQDPFSLKPSATRIPCGAAA